MKSGPPAYGTPSHFQAPLAAGQLARSIGRPWRSAARSASNLNDVQTATENQFGLWGCLMAGATMIIYSAGWIEGRLSLSYEKLITDTEIGVDAIEETQPSGHFFASAQPMARFQTEFYAPRLRLFQLWHTDGMRHKRCPDPRPRYLGRNLCKPQRPQNRAGLAERSPRRVAERRRRAGQICNAGDAAWRFMFVLLLVFR